MIRACRCLGLLCLLAVSFYLGGCPSSSSAPENTAARLLPFSDCSALGDYFAEMSRQQQLLTAWDAVTVEFLAEAPTSPAMEIAADLSTSGEAPVDYSGTNLQESGVAEADFSAFDGETLYLIQEEKLMLFDAWPAEESHELARLPLAGSPFALFVAGDDLLVLSHIWDLTTLPVSSFAPQGWGVLKLSLFDISDRSTPTLRRELYLEGNYVDARLVAGRLHLLLAAGMSPLLGIGVSGLPELAIEPQPQASAAATPSAESFPTYLDLRYSDGVATPVTDLLCSCENVYRPTIPAGGGILTLLTLDLADPLGELQSVSILGNQGTVYASEENLYVVSTNSDAWLWWPVQAGVASRPSTTSQIHRFSLGATPRYAGSGTVPGWILNRYSLDEEGDVLRVATTEPGWVRGTLPVNRLTTLQLTDDGLPPLGNLEGLGKPGESIFAVRLLGERGYVVTFLQTDPFYVLDLSDPLQPKTLGELEVPGFSTYLHPVDADHLLAIGREGGVKLSLYNVQDGANPTEVATYSLGTGSSSSAEYDPHAFNYFPRNQMLAIPVTTWGVDAFDVTGYNVSSRLELFSIDPASSITPYGQVDHSDFYREAGTSLWYTPETVRRSYFASSESFDYLYSLSPRGVQVNRVDQLEPSLVQLPLPAAPVYWAVPDSTVTE